MAIWQKKLKKFLSDSDLALVSRKNCEAEALALPVLRVASAAKNPLVVALPDSDAADKLMADLEFWKGKLKRPEKLLALPECGRGKLILLEGESRRARALDLALEGNFDIAVGSVSALFGPAPPPEETNSAKLTLTPGTEISPEQLAAQLLKLDYDDEWEVATPGDFARRGGIIDIYSPAHEQPCRIEFFGDTIESMRLFSPQTQRSTGSVTEYRIIGRSGITAGGAAKSDAMSYFEQFAHHLLVVQAEKSRDALTHYLSDTAAERFDHCLEVARQNQALTRFLDAAESAGVEAIAEADFAPRSTPEIITDSAIRIGEERLRRDRLREELDNFTRAKYTVVISARDEADIPAVKSWCEAEFLALPQVEFAALNLSGGFTLGVGLVVIAEAELAGAGFRYTAENSTPPPAPRPDAELPDNPLPDIHLADLDVGDLAVHLDYGIGIYRGLRKIQRDGVTREMIELEYQDHQLLHVPLLQAHKISRYLGAAGRVKLHDLHSHKWQKEQLRAQSGVRSYAADMLRMQALRESLPGISFPPDDGTTAAFLRAFAFSDTLDQIRSTEEIRRDMQSSRPMDRLICGDVGYGKTELAMRAAFRAVSAGYQVAVLAPTTVLAHQHLQSFAARFAEYPFNLAELSRFESERKQRETVEKLASGQIDIVIGTHRLCSEKIHFRNLGLVIIDEEQRFGVEHKERLRRFRAEADVLTMSATPIPRTLYLAMAGARDMSTLMTAPKLRLPVRTVVAPPELKTIHDAICSELARGGQVYYLHNRIKTIDECADQLRALVPGARIAVSHGQMPEAELEKNMQDFLSGKIDCLVCSTIIESGLDVPNANTIIIENADRFGLAQLYQLRGRVGRWTRQAYAYLLLPKSRFIGSDARRRLNAICRCTKLGSGIQLALQDLEIRGAGNILGAEQSGHINTIGFDLYCSLLKQAVADLHGTPLRFLPEVDMTIDFVSFSLTARPGELPAAIPEQYIGGERLRIAAYGRIAKPASVEDIAECAADFADRFGPLPDTVRNLLQVAKLRILAARANYTIFTVIDGRVSLYNPGGAIYRDEKGRAPQLDYRDAPELRLRQLEKIMQKI